MSDYEERRERARRLSGMAADARIMRKLGSRMTLGAYHVLLEVACRPGVTMRQLSEATGLAQASISRNLQSLGKTHRTDSPGFDLVETQRDPAEGRRYQAFLTPRGEAYVEMLTRQG